jgi:hypothetical protein
VRCSANAWHVVKRSSSLRLRDASNGGADDQADHGGGCGEFRGGGGGLGGVGIILWGVVGSIDPKLVSTPKTT